MTSPCQRRAATVQRRAGAQRDRVEKQRRTQARRAARHEERTRIAWLGGPGAEAAGGPEQARPGPAALHRCPTGGCAPAMLGRSGSRAGHGPAGMRRPHLSRQPRPRRFALPPAILPTAPPPSAAAPDAAPAEGYPVHGAARAPAAFSMLIPMRTMCPAMPPPPPTSPWPSLRPPRLQASPLRAGAALHAACMPGPDDSAALVQGKGAAGRQGRAAEPRARRGPRS